MTNTWTLTRTITHKNWELPAVTFTKGSQVEGELRTILGSDYVVVIASDGTQRALASDALK